MKRSTFSPLLYSGVKSENSDSQEIEKGSHKKQIDLYEVERLLDRLLLNNHVKWKDISGELKNDWEQFIGYVKILYGKDEYNRFYDLIRSKFKDIHKYEVKDYQCDMKEVFIGKVRTYLTELELGVFRNEVSYAG